MSSSANSYVKLLVEENNMIKERKDIDSKYKWDLSSLYVDDEAFEEEFKNTEALIESIKEIKGTLLLSVDHLVNALQVFFDTQIKVTRLNTYSKMKQDENTKDSFYQGLNSRSDSLYVTFNAANSFLIPELLSDVEKVKQYMEDPSLGLYKQFMENILRRKPHTLSEEVENILAEAGELMSAPENAFGMLNGADLKFPQIKNGKGETVEITHGSFIPLLMDNDRQVREEAFKSYYKVFEGHINTFASLLSSEVKKNIFNARSRNHSSARASALFENNVPESVYDQLIDAVHNNLDSLHDYMRLRKKMLGVDTLRPFDLYVPLLKDVDMKYSFDHAQEVVLESLEVLGDTYTSTVKNSFSDAWIDVYETLGKRSGAYSWGMYSSKPYILLNYHDELSDVFTLTHEMGHSMHSYYTRKTQPYVYGNYSIFVAEVASTTNEALLNHHLLKTVKDKRERLYLLNNHLENFRGTVFRQTMFAEFERDIHKHVENGGALTAETLNSMYRALNQKYYGSLLDIDHELDLEWARIPHFYYNFYVFQYATGFSSAAALADMIIEDPNHVTKYLDFLGAGSSDYPIEVLKKAGVDMTTPDPVNNALLVFRNLVKEMETLI